MGGALRGEVGLEEGRVGLEEGREEGREGRGNLNPVSKYDLEGGGRGMVNPVSIEAWRGACVLGRGVLEVCMGVGWGGGKGLSKTFGTG